MTVSSEVKEKLKGFLIVSLSLIIFLYLLRYLFPIFLPFLLSLLFAALIAPSARIMIKLRIGKTAATVLCTTVFFSLIGILISLFTKFILSEALAFAGNALSEPEKLFEGFNTFVTGISEKYPILNRITDLTELSDTILSCAEKIASFIISRAGEFAMKSPDIILFAAVTIFSTYYLTGYFLSDKEKLRKMLPESVRSILASVSDSINGYTGKYLKLNLIIFFVNIIELFTGLLIAGEKHSFTLAVLISLIDILPILGVGTVLIPWAVISFILGKTYKGIVLVVLYLIMTIVRQYIEHKYISKAVGIPPLLSVLSIYAGYRLFGFIGIILAPLFAGIGYSLIKDS